MNKRLTLAAAVTATGLLAVPSIASANSTCTYNAAAKTATVQLNNPTFGSPTIIRPTIGFGAHSIDIADGDTTGFSGCYAPGDTTKQATVFNTDRIVVNGTPGYEHVELNQGFLKFAPGATPEPSGLSGIEISLLTGSGGDELSVVGSGFADAMSAYGTTLGGRVDLDNDGDHDVSISRPSRITLHGASGDDRLSGVSVFGQISLAAGHPRRPRGQRHADRRPCQGHTLSVDIAATDKPAGRRPRTPPARSRSASSTIRGSALPRRAAARRTRTPGRRPARAATAPSLASPASSQRPSGDHSRSSRRPSALNRTVLRRRISVRSPRATARARPRRRRRRRAGRRRARAGCACRSRSRGSCRGGGRRSAACGRRPTTRGARTPPLR